MRRVLAPLAVAAVLRAAPAAADPMDLELQRLGAPAASIWLGVNQQCLASGKCPGVALTAGEAANLARESQQRWRTLVMQLGLGLTAFSLDDPTTGGSAGFAVSLEGGQTAIRHPQAGAAPAPFGPAFSAWPVRGTDPSALRTFAVHVQKGLPYSLQVGGRFLYVDQSLMAAAQAELRWALNESYGPAWAPDAALRVAYTRLLGQRDLDLSVIDLDAMVGKRFGLGGAVRVTPYAVMRLSMVGAQSQPIDFGPTAGACTGSCFPDTRPPGEILATTAPFAEVKFSQHRIVRWALGAKLVSGSVAAAAELTYYPGQRLASRDQLAEVLVPDSLGGALRLGFDF